MVVFFKEIPANLLRRELGLDSLVRRALRRERVRVEVLVVAHRGRERDQERRLPARRELEARRGACARNHDVRRCECIRHLVLERMHSCRQCHLRILGHDERLVLRPSLVNDVKGFEV